jgi:hypothetical protein
MLVPSSMNEAPQEVQTLFAQAGEGRITPIDFCKALDQHGISHVQKLLYIRDAFGLRLEQAKAVLIEAEYGSVDIWSEEMGRAINELSSEIKCLDKTGNTE